jgi:hypothetical protein
MKFSMLLEICLVLLGFIDVLFRSYRTSHWDGKYNWCADSTCSFLRTNICFFLTVPLPLIACIHTFVAVVGDYYW